jgi:hypothetical protein
MVARGLFLKLFHSIELFVMQTMPVSRESYFRWRAIKLAWFAAGIGLAYGIFFLPITLALSTDLRLLWWTVPLGIVQALLCLALMWLAVRYLPIRQLQNIGNAFLLTMGVLFVARGALVPILAGYMTVITDALPCGWLLGVYERGVLHQDAVGWLGLVPAIAIIVAGGRVFRWGEKNYHLPEARSPLAHGTTPEFVNTPLARERAEATALEKIEHAQWSPESSGTIVRLAWQRLTAREKAVARFLRGEVMPEWDRKWIRALKVTAIALALGILLGENGLWVLIIAGLLSALLVLPVFGGDWQGINAAFCSGGFIPVFALFPVGYWEIQRTAFKINFVRCVAWIPFAILFALGISWVLQQSPLQAIVVALKIILLTMLAQPFWITLRISRTTNDTDGLRLRAIPSLASGLLAIVLMLPAAFAVVYPSWLTALCGLVVYAAGSFSFMAIYAWCFHKLHIDLCRRTR